MARITVSNKLFPNGEQMLKGYSDKYVQAMANKLSNLEDIEDELGIPLITFFKFLSAEEVFFINDFNEIQRAIVRSIHKKGIIVFEKALEIIKEKEVDAGLIIETPNVAHYNRYFEHSKIIYLIKKLTEEQFDLLKEVLE